MVEIALEQRLQLFEPGVYGVQRRYCRQRGAVIVIRRLQNLSCHENSATSNVDFTHQAVADERKRGEP